MEKINNTPPLWTSHILLDKSLLTSNYSCSFTECKPESHFSFLAFLNSRNVKMGRVGIFNSEMTHCTQNYWYEFCILCCHLGLVSESKSKIQKDATADVQWLQWKPYYSDTECHFSGIGSQ